MVGVEGLAAAIRGAGPAGRVWLRQGVIVACGSDGTATVTVGGSSVGVEGVRVAAHVCPVPGTACWLVTDGRDLMVWATLAGAGGPAFGSIRQTAAQSIPDTTWTDLVWSTRTGTVRGMGDGAGGLTVVVPGVYQVTGSVGVGGTWTSGTVYGALTVDGTVEVYGTGMATPSNSSYTMRAAVAGVVSCAAGAVLGLRVHQSAGESRSTSIGAGQNVLAAVWVGP